MSSSDSDTAGSKFSGERGGDDAFVKMVETGQIGYRLADEIRSLREELLNLKQEKRILLVNSENLEDALENANCVIAKLKTALSEAEASSKKYCNDKSKKVQLLFQMMWYLCTEHHSHFEIIY